MRSLRKTHISGQFSLIPSFLRLCVCVFTSNSILGAASVLHCFYLMEESLMQLWFVSKGTAFMISLNIHQDLFRIMKAKKFFFRKETQGLEFSVSFTAVMAKYVSLKNSLKHCTDMKPCVDYFKLYKYLLFIFTLIGYSGFIGCFPVDWSFFSFKGATCTTG